MELKETVEMMCSSDYQERFKAEYYQLKIRYDKLCEMCQKWDEGKLAFTPACSRGTYNYQLEAMYQYLQVLENRAYIEGIDLERIESKRIVDRCKNTPIEQVIRKYEEK